MSAMWTKVKVIIIGDSRTGKTSLMLRHCDGRFASDVTSTIGIDYRSDSYILDGRHYMMQIWDTAGQERFQDITNSYYRDIDAALIVFDLSNRKTFESIPAWHRRLYARITKPPIVILIGNKSDLTATVSLSEIQNMAAELGIPSYIQSSAKDGAGINDIFEQLPSRLAVSVSHPVLPCRELVHPVIQPAVTTRSCCSGIGYLP